jgi:hypothetical protein
MGPKPRTATGPGVGAIGGWKNKDYSTVLMEELFFIMKKASSEQSRRSREFKVNLNKFKEGHLVWALQELNAAKGLLSDTLCEYSDMLNTVMLRDNVWKDATMRESTAASLRENEQLGINSHEKWFHARETAEGRMEAENPRKPKHRRNRETEEGEDDDNKVEVDARRRTLKISSLDGLRPAPANEQFTQVEMDYFLEHARIWGSGLQYRIPRS